MKTNTASPLPDTAFWAQYQGRFSGILNWPEVDAFWQSMMDAPGDWYVFDPDHTAPHTAATDSELAEMLSAAKVMINTRRDRSHCGAIYVDDIANPAFVKIFDPAAMGSACSISTARILPRWIISRIKPDNLPATPPPEKPTLLRRLTGRT